MSNSTVFILGSMKVKTESKWVINLSKLNNPPDLDNMPKFKDVVGEAVDLYCSVKTKMKEPYHLKAPRVLLNSLVSTSIHQINPNEYKSKEWLDTWYRCTPLTLQELKTTKIQIEKIVQALDDGKAKYPRDCFKELMCAIEERKLHVEEYAKEPELTKQEPDDQATKKRKVAANNS